MEPILGGSGRQEEGRLKAGPEMERREEKQEIELLEEEPSPPYKLGKSPSPTREPSEEQYTMDESVDEGPLDQGTSDKRWRRKTSRNGKKRGTRLGALEGPGLEG